MKRKILLISIISLIVFTSGCITNGSYNASNITSPIINQTQAVTSFNYICGNGVCENIELKINEGEMKEVISFNQVYSIVLVGTINSTYAGITVNEEDIFNKYQFIEEKNNYTIKGLPIYVNNVLHTPGDNDLNYIELIIGENDLTCLVDCGGRI